MKIIKKSDLDFKIVHLKKDIRQSNYFKKNLLEKFKGLCQIYGLIRF